MKLLNHPHIIKLYQVRIQLYVLLLLLASVSFFNFQQLKSTVSEGCLAGWESGS